MSNNTEYVKDLKEKRKRFVRTGKGKSMLTNRRHAFVERLDNHDYRDRRDLNVLKRLSPSVRNRTEADYLPNQYIKKVKSDD